MRNYEMLCSESAPGAPGGKLFAHLFVHRDLLYPFETPGEDNGLGRHFFTGGLMPCRRHAAVVSADLRIEAMWSVPGNTLRAYRQPLAAEPGRPKTGGDDSPAGVYGAELASLWFQRWRMFWMACAELFGYDRGGMNSRRLMPAPRA